MSHRRSAIDPFLVLRAQLGDREAVERLLSEAAAMLRPYVCGLMSNESDAQDTLQESLVLIWRKLHQLDEPRAFGAWAHRIASREAQRAIRKRSRLSRETSMAAEPESGPVAGEPDKEEIARILARVSELPANTRDIVLLHYGAGFSLRLVGTITGAPVGTVKSRLNVALRKLREAADGSKA